MKRVTAKAMEPNVFARSAEIEHPVDGREVEVAGPLSVRTSALIRTELAQAIDHGDGDLIVRLSRAEVCDATGLGVLMGAHHRASRCGRRLVVAEASPRLCRLMKATKLDRVIAQSDAASMPTALAS